MFVGDSYNGPVEHMHKGSWVKHWRKRQLPSMSQEDLAEMVKEQGGRASRSLVAQWESELQEPADNVLPVLERIFGVHYPNTSGKVSNGHTRPTHDAGVDSDAARVQGEMPFWGTIPSKISGLPVAGSPMEQVPIELVREGAGLLKVKGDSLKPEFRPNDLLFVVPSNTEHHGRWNVCYGASGVTTLRYIDDTKEGPVAYDGSLNHAGIPSDYTFLGFVADMLRRF